MTRLLLMLSLVSLVGCTPALNNGPPPVEDLGDDDDTTASSDPEELWESLDPGECDAVPDNDMLLPYGEGRATTGLWYELACWWIGGNASSITFQFEYFDERNGGDFDLASIDVRDIGGTFVSVEGTSASSTCSRATAAPSTDGGRAISPAWTLRVRRSSWTRWCSGTRSWTRSWGADQADLLVRAPPRCGRARSCARAFPRTGPGPRRSSARWWTRRPSRRARTPGRSRWAARRGRPASCR